MPKTPWAKTSSLPSDRIRPKNVQSQPQKKHNTHSGPEQPIPKSNVVTRLEHLISNLKSSDGANPNRDAKGRCFCQAREHPLSSYTPICPSCGLILCQLNKPHNACPHCSSALLNSRQRSSLLDRLQTELEQTLVKEQAERDRQVEEAKRAAGAFPSLSSSFTHTSGQHSSSTPMSAPVPRPAVETHKVLSINAKTKRVVVSSYTSTPASSRPVSRNSQAEATTNPDEGPDSVRVVPPPPLHVDHANGHVDASRPWQNLNHRDSVIYIPPPKSNRADHTKSHTSRTTTIQS